LNGLEEHNKKSLFMKKIAVIVAGGKSSRMQEDKALLPFGNFNSLAEYQYVRLLQFFDNVYISAKSNKFDFPATIIEDGYESSSPLVALVSIFETLITVDEVFVLSVDAPLISTQMIEQLYQEAKHESVVIVARSKQGLEPLCAIYRRGILNEAKKFLEEGNHRLQLLLSKVMTQEVEMKEDDLFLNLNHPSDYQKALNVFRSTSS
jgi:molybdopterin-guanine dinucleotide biosynthesis protein A